MESSEWQKCLALPSIPYVLRMLAGLCKQHNQTQKSVIAAVENIHLLEQVSTEKHIGTLAENVLESMMENPDCQAEVSSLLKPTIPPQLSHVTRYMHIAAYMYVVSVCLQYVQEEV